MNAPLPHDTFARDRLPSADAMPEFVFERAELQYPPHLNAVERFVDRHVREGRGERLAIHGDAQRWTYRELLACVNRIANTLVEDLHVAPGHRVLLRAPNSPLLAACWLAVLRVGAIAVTTMPLYRATELHAVIDKAQVNAALCDERLLDEFERATSSVPTRLQMMTFGQLRDRMQQHSDSFEPVQTAADDVALIAFTSGTTGAPKAAMHYHRELLATCDTYGAEVLQPHADDVFCGTPPLAFTFGLGGHVLFPLDAGASTVLLEKITPADLPGVIARFGVTTLFTAPVAYRAMLNEFDAAKLATLRTCVSAGETLSSDIFDAWERATGIRLLDGIGSTEMLHIFIGSPRNATRSGYTGCAVPGYRAEIHDENGNTLPRNTVGRLAVKGPTGCKYLDDPRQSSYVQNGWNYPGDAYVQDDDGYFRYVARTDDMIVASGYNVSGPEVEEILRRHAAVSEVAVVAKPDPQRGTSIVKAFVVLAPGYHGDTELADELRAHVKALIAPFKAPREVAFIDALPRTETGKVQRFKLRERAASE